MNKRLAFALSVMLTISSGLPTAFADTEVIKEPVATEVPTEAPVEEPAEEAVVEPTEGVFDEFILVEDKETQMPEFMIGEITEPTNDGVDEVVESFFNNNQTFFRVEDSNANYADYVEVLDSFDDNLGLTVVRTQQVIDGMPIIGYDQAMTVDEDGVIRSVSGNVLPSIDKIEKELDKDKKYSDDEAIEIAIEDLGFEPTYYEVDPSSEDVIFMKNRKPVAAYRVKLNFLEPEPGYWMFIIDGQNGEILKKYNKIHTEGPVIGFGTDYHGNVHEINTYELTNVLDEVEYALYDDTRGGGILIYDGKLKRSLPGTIWYDKDNELHDEYDGVAVDALVNAGIVYDYYSDMHGRKSFDDNDARIRSTVHYKKDYVNAFWNGYQMVYGDGDGQEYLPFAAALDVVGHELTHAVTEKTANLEYEGESGAINEAMSDIFGTLIEFYAGDDPDWLCGEDIVGPENGDNCMRSLEDPTIVSNFLTGPYPDHTSKMYEGTLDYGGVHINSSIINKAAYLISEGGTHNGETVDGIGKEKMGAIFYRALSAHMTSQTDFAELREIMIYSATELYGTQNHEFQTIKDAFDAVGITNDRVPRR